MKGFFKDTTLANVLPVIKILLIGGFLIWAYSKLKKILSGIGGGLSVGKSGAQRLSERKAQAGGKVTNEAGFYNAWFIQQTLMDAGMKEDETLKIVNDYTDYMEWANTYKILGFDSLSQSYINKANKVFYIGSGSSW